MTDAQLKKLAKENNIEPTYELLAFARLVLINAKIQDLKLVAINTRLAVEKEREACAKKREWVGLTDTEVIDISKSTSVYGSDNHYEVLEFVASIEAKLKEKNT